MLAYYHHMEPAEFALFPVVPAHPYVLNKYICNLTDFSPDGREIPGPTGKGIWDPNSYGQFLGGTSLRRGRDKGFTDASHIAGQAMRTNGCKPKMVCSNITIEFPASISGVVGVSAGNRRWVLLSSPLVRSPPPPSWAHNRISHDPPSSPVLFPAPGPAADTATLRRTCAAAATSGTRCGTSTCTLSTPRTIRASPARAPPGLLGDREDGTVGSTLSWLFTVENTEHNTNRTHTHTYKPTAHALSTRRNRGNGKHTYISPIAIYLASFFLNMPMNLPMTSALSST